jgi:hypothetical protein
MSRTKGPRPSPINQAASSTSRVRVMGHHKLPGKFNQVRLLPGRGDVWVSNSGTVIGRMIQQVGEEGKGALAVSYQPSAIRFYADLVWVIVSF